MNIRKPKTAPPEYNQTPKVVFQPRTGQGFQQGINQIVDAIRPSLGPFPRLVAIERATTRTKSPELLDSGGTIARRIIEIPGSVQNAGAMFIRGALWNLNERVGDGVATAAILFQSIFNQGMQYIASGGNAMILRHNLEKGMGLILSALDGMLVPVVGSAALTGVAKTVCHDYELAEILGDTISIIGEHGVLDLRSGYGRGVERDLIEGSYWPGAIVSNSLIYDRILGRTVFENAAILISDLEIEDPQTLLPIIRAVTSAQINCLVIMATKVSEPIQGMLFQSKDSEKLQMIAVKTPGMQSDVQMTNMIDIAVLTGGIPLRKATGDQLERVTPEHFGYARRIWANENYIGLVHPQGDPKQVRVHLDSLRMAFNHAKKPEDRLRLQERIGKLLGGAAVIQVGGMTETEIETRKEMAERTAVAVRAAAREGILPGGGTALLACRPALDALLDGDVTVDARAAHRILWTALETPFKTILSNCGYSPEKFLATIEEAEAGSGFDVITGQICQMILSGIVDVAEVQKQALISAVRSAALALTIDVLVHRKKLPIATTPDSPGL
jgi:chaperonin GroEL